MVVMQEKALGVNVVVERKLVQHKSTLIEVGIIIILFLYFNRDRDSYFSLNFIYSV